MSRLIARARHGRTVTNIAWHTAAELRLRAMDMRRRMSLERLYKSEVARIREVEQEAYDEINSRPYDVEEMRDLELMMVVSNLTNFRLNRLAYAGRVLP